MYIDKGNSIIIGLTYYENDLLWNIKYTGWPPKKTEQSIF